MILTSRTHRFHAVTRNALRALRTPPLRSAPRDATPLGVRARGRFPRVFAIVAVLGALAVLAPLGAQAQRTEPATLSGAILARVQRMVNGGDRDGARAYADSMVQATPEGSEGYVEALYARAFASSSAVEAERDYLRVSVEYSLSPRAEDATMMVAQLKLARGDRTGARRNFERLVREHPEGSQAAKAAYWAGRLAIEDGDLPHGCQSLATSKARVSADDVELVNQIDYYRQRCSAGALAAAAPADTASPGAASAAKGGKDAKATGAKAKPKTAKERAKERADSIRAEKARLAAERTARARDEKERIAAERAEKLRVQQEHADAARAEQAERVERERTAADSAAAAAAVPGKQFTVQVAAFPKVRDAEALKDVLQQRGYEARVWGAKAPFRVRVGRYATREEADAALARMKGSRLNGMVVEAEPQ